MSYLLIKDNDKWKVDWLIPAILMALTFLAFFYFAQEMDWIGNNGLILSLQGFLQILPGFYLASLAAIATFNKEDLDLALPSPTPTIIIQFVRDKRLREKTIDLTRRRMLCYLFGYLTFISLFLYLSTVFAQLISVNVYISVFLKGFFILLFWQMIVVTVFGLYQLCDRIHQVSDD